MKKVILTVLMVIPMLIKSQTDSIYVMSITDEMDGKTFYRPSGKKISIINNETKQGINISAFIDKEGENLVVRDLNVNSAGVGNCMEGDELIILFEDGSKITLKSWNSFNCKGNSWFTIGKSDEESLSTKRINKIRLTNGRTFESLTGEVDASKKDYFIQLFFAVNNKKVKPAKSK
jgi:hypothetical protein